MDTKKIIEKLNQLYPGKQVFLNKDKLGKVVEILCEVEPATDHPEYSFAIAVIDNSSLHYHKATNEKYRVVEGSLRLYIDGNLVNLSSGDEYTILPGHEHRAEGKETWVEVHSEPGWTFSDHILVADPKPGDIYWLKTYDSIPHPQVIIEISNDTLRLCALTTNMKKAHMPGNVLLDVGEGNLEKQSIVEVSKVLTVNKSELKDYTGSITESRVAEILNGIGFINRSFLRH